MKEGEFGSSFFIQNSSFEMGGLRRPRDAWVSDASPKHLREACEKSLRALGAARVWLYQLHAPDPKVPFEKSVETLAIDSARSDEVTLASEEIAAIDAEEFSRT